MILYPGAHAMCGSPSHDQCTSILPVISTGTLSIFKLEESGPVPDDYHPAIGFRDKFCHHMTVSTYSEIFYHSNSLPRWCRN